MDYLVIVFLTKNWEDDSILFVPGCELRLLKLAPNMCAGARTHLPCSVNVLLMLRLLCPLDLLLVLLSHVQLLFLHLPSLYLHYVALLLNDAYFIPKSLKNDISWVEKN